VMLQFLEVIVLGLMCGSEINVAAFIHPALRRQALEIHIPVRSSFAQLLGRVMPFWFAGSTLVNLLILLPFEHLNGSAWRLSAIALVLQVFAVVLSVTLAVPINNRIAGWTVVSIPGNWRALERRWDFYHAFRTCALVVALALLVLSFAGR
jgi:uncharacterized membrane protein